MNGVFSFDQAKILSQKYSILYGFLDMRSIRRKRKIGFEKKLIHGLELIGLNIPVGRIPKKFFIPLQDFFMKILMKRIAKEESRINIIHTHFFDLSHSVLKNKSIIKAKYILTEHASSMNSLSISDFDKKIANYAYTNSDVNLAVSKPLINSLFLNFKMNFKLLENVYDFKLFRFAEKHEKNDNFTFISIGSLINRKGMELTIKSFYDAFGTESDKKLLIIGDGPEKTNLSILINKLNLEASVNLLGQKTREEISDLLRSSHVLILLSKRETFGVVYIEALASGLPVIATVCGGPEDFIDTTNGYLIPQKDIYLVPKILKEIALNYDSFDQKTISMDTYEKFGPEAFISKIEKIYFD